MEVLHYNSEGIVLCRVDALNSADYYCTPPPAATLHVLSNGVVEEGQRGDDTGSTCSASVSALSVRMLEWSLMCA